MQDLQPQIEDMFCDTTRTFFIGQPDDEMREAYNKVRNTLLMLEHFFKPNVKACEIYSEMDKKVGHWRRYTKTELIAKVQQAGFRVVACRYMDGIGWFASWLYKFNKNSQGNVNPRLLKIYDKWVMPLSILWDKLTLGSFLGKNIWLEAQK